MKLTDLFHYRGYICVFVCKSDLSSGYFSYLDYNKKACGCDTTRALSIKAHSVLTFLKHPLKV